MTQTFERPRTEVEPRPPVLPEYETPALVRWIPWLLGLVMVAVVAVALWMSVPVYDSHDRAEEIRFEQIATNRYPIDNSMERAEFIRFEQIATNRYPIDNSMERAEFIHFEQAVGR